jgi:subtilisin family serine protease
MLLPVPRPLAAVVVAALAAAALAAPASAAPAASPLTSPSTPSTAKLGQTGRVTLITGDTVQVTAAGAGRFTALVQPAAGREQITFHTLEVDGGLRVLPSDVVPYLSSGILDANLFDVQELLAEGYGDGSASTLPLIVQYGNGPDSPRAARALRPLGRSTHTLTSIDATAVNAGKADLAGFWRSTAAAATNSAARSSPPRLGQGIKDIWLDRKVHATLDRSTAQIGAPAVWAGGHDGTGVKVAVLDTGVDATHPDLQGRISRSLSFTGDPDTTDRFGHGTHVASIIAGSGAASGGSRKGVAPGASLLIGKVMGDDGSGQESWIIAGMEWAAAQKATVVNLSLGGGPTDGTDPMSEAVNRITAESGTLFVVSAGNDGTDQSVGTPGAATSALTVGAVDRDDSLAEFSSRGPRLGDEGLKPEITAPGVGIMAARAAGTDIGDNDGQYYTALSGTSMAAPHVAGAAALLAQIHPDWTATRLKNGLVSAAHTSTDGTVYGQGAGRVDIARAATATVEATGVADFGLHTSAGAPASLSKTVTYTNDGPAPVTLSLSTTITNLTTHTTTTAISTGTRTVTVPAGGSVDEPVVVDLAHLARGEYSGWITATAPGDVRTTTAVGITLEGPRHKVTFKAVDRNGKATNVPVVMLHGDSSRSDYLGYLLGGSGPVADVEEGTYLLDALIEQGGPHEQATLITNPELKITKDVQILLDARTGTPIRIQTPKPSQQQNVLSYYVHRTTGSGRTISHGVMHFSNVEQVNVTPTTPVKSGSYEFSSRWQLVEPMVQATVGGAKVPANLTRYSPSYNGRRRLPLVYAGHGTAAELAAVKTKGAAVIIRSTDEPSGATGPSEAELTAAAAKRGAAVTVLVRPAGWSTWTSWTPIGDREPIDSVVVASGDASAMIAKARTKGASIDLTLTTSSPYLYDVQQVSAGRVPSSIVYRVTAANSARITSRYADNGGVPWEKEQRFGWRPWQTFSWNDTSRFVQTPKTREEWVTAGDSIWQQQVRPDWPWNDEGQLAGGATQLPRHYSPRHSTTTWLSPVVRPASPIGVPALVSTRTGDTLNLRIPEFVDSSGHYTIGEATRTSASLTRDGVALAQLGNARQDVDTTKPSAAYQLSLDTVRTDDEWTWGVNTSTVWNFRSAGTGSSTPQPLPLLQIDPVAPVDLTGRAPATTHTVALTVRDQDGRPAPARATLTAELSTDNGVTWRSVHVLGSGLHYRAVIPAGHAPISLRLKATDPSGNSVQQTVIRAYGRH